MNVILAVFNLIPIPPLDGSALIERCLPALGTAHYYQLRMGFLIVVLLLVFVDKTRLSTVLGDIENWYFASGLSDRVPALDAASDAGAGRQQPDGPLARRRVTAATALALWAPLSSRPGTTPGSAVSSR